MGDEIRAQLRLGVAGEVNVYWDDDVIATILLSRGPSSALYVKLSVPTLVGV